MALTAWLNSFFLAVLFCIGILISNKQETNSFISYLRLDCTDYLSRLVSTSWVALINWA